MKLHHSSHIDIIISNSSSKQHFTRKLEFNVVVTRYTDLFLRFSIDIKRIDTNIGLRSRGESPGSRLVPWYKLLYKPMAKSMGNGKFRTPTAPKSVDRFWYNLKPRTTLWRSPTMQNFISIRQRGWSRRIPSLWLSGFFLCLSFFVSSSCVQVAPVDRSWRSIRHMTSFQHVIQI